MSRRVLIVDADVELRGLLERVMSEAGYRCDAAIGASDARVRSAERPADLVLLDLDLPSEAAWSLLTELRTRERPPAVVGMGGMASLASFLRAVQGGVAGFSARPLQLGDLVTTCRRVLEAGESAAAGGDERREQTRRALRVHLNVLSESGEPLAVAELIDLSATGARFLLLAPFESGARVRLSLSSDSRTTLEGRVCWRSRTRDGWAHGVEFAGLTPELRGQLASLKPQAAEA